MHRGLPGYASPAPNPLPQPSTSSLDPGPDPSCAALPAFLALAPPPDPGLRSPPPLSAHFPAPLTAPPHPGRVLTQAVSPPTAATRPLCCCQVTMVSVPEVRGQCPLAQSLLGLVVPAEGGARPSASCPSQPGPSPGSAHGLPV